MTDIEITDIMPGLANVNVRAVVNRIRWLTTELRCQMSNYVVNPGTIEFLMNSLNSSLRSRIQLNSLNSLNS